MKRTRNCLDLVMPAVARGHHPQRTCCSLSKRSYVSWSVARRPMKRKATSWRSAFCMRALGEALLIAQPSCAGHTQFSHCAATLARWGWDRQDVQALEDQVCSVSFETLQAMPEAAVEAIIVFCADNLDRECSARRCAQSTAPRCARELLLGPRDAGRLTKSYDGGRAESSFTCWPRWCTGT